MDYSKLACDICSNKNKIKQICAYHIEEQIKFLESKKNSLPKNVDCDYCNLRKEINIMCFNHLKYFIDDKKFDLVERIKKEQLFEKNKKIKGVYNASIEINKSIQKLDLKIRTCYECLYEEDVGISVCPKHKKLFNTFKIPIDQNNFYPF